jgi:hypothetical protein
VIPAQRGKTELMSLGLVAYNAIRLKVLDAFTEVNGGARRAIRKAEKRLKNVAKLGLGTNGPEKINLAELNLGW